jgi:hypothetical protein
VQDESTLENLFCGNLKGEQIQDAAEFGRNLLRGDRALVRRFSQASEKLDRHLPEPDRFL